MFICIIEDIQNKTRDALYNQKYLSVAFQTNSRKPSDKLTNPRTSQDIHLEPAADLEGKAINIINIHKVTSLLQRSQPFLHITITQVINK